MSDVKVYTFNVGQGLFNLLTEIVDNGTNNVTKFCAIFDCGTLNTSHPAIEANLKLAVDIIEEFGGLDLIVISHQDEDHWNLCMKLLIKYYKIYIGNDWFIIKTKHGCKDMYLIKSSCKDNKYKILHEYPYNWFTLYEYYNDGNKHDFEKSYDINVYDVKEEEKKVELELTVETKHDNNKIKYEIVILEKKVYVVCIEVNGKTKRYYKNEYENKIFKDFNQSLAYFLKGCIDDDIRNLKDYENFERPDCKNVIEKLIPEIIVCGDERSPRYNEFYKKMEFFGEKVSSYDCTGITYFRYNKIDYNHFFLINFNYSYLNIATIRNATSTISVYEYDDKSIIFPGDATLHVFDYISKAIEVSPPVELLIAPHHGSFDTNILVDDNGNLLPDDNQPFLHFLSVIQPKAVFISALLSKFGHPDLKFLEYVSKFAQSSYPHKIVYKNKSISDKNKENEIIKYVKKKAVFSTESNSNKYLLFPDILHRAVNELSKPQENNFILPPDDLFI